MPHVVLDEDQRLFLSTVARVVSTLKGLKSPTPTDFQSVTDRCNLANVLLLELRGVILGAETWGPLNNIASVFFTATSNINATFGLFDFTDQSKLVPIPVSDKVLVTKNNGQKAEASRLDHVLETLANAKMADPTTKSNAAKLAWLLFLNLIARSSARK